MSFFESSLQALNLISQVLNNQILLGRDKHTRTNKIHTLEVKFEMGGLSQDEPRFAQLLKL